MWQSLKIVNRYYWKSLFGPGIMFILSVLMLFVVTSCLDLGALVKPFMAIPGIFCSMILLYGMLFIPVTINDLRGSIVMKRISSSRITTFQFLLTLLIYYFVFTIISYLWYIAWGFLIFVNKINEYINALQMINIGSLLYATLISNLLRVFFGFFVLIFTKRNYVVCIVAFIFLIYGLAFATYIAPIALVHNLTIIPGSTTDYRATDLYYFVDIFEDLCLFYKRIYFY